MAPIVVLLLLSSSLFIPSYTRNLQSSDQEAFISVLITQKGLDFAKNLLVNQKLPSLFPLKLPNLKKKTKIPLLGTLEIALSNIIINDFDLLSSDVKPGDKGITISTSGVAANLSTSWYYKYYTSLLPLKVCDEGNASIQFDGTQAGLTLGLENQNGTLELSLEDYSFYVKDLSIKVHGGKPWPYQRLVGLFEKTVEATLANAITKKINEGIVKLNSLLQALPTEIPVYGNASIDLSLVKPPSFSNSSIQFDFNGLFGGKSNISVPQSRNEFNSVCSSKMLGILVDVGVINSASATLYDDLQWVVDEIPGQNLLNTAGWKFVIPTLYLKYPDCDMNFDISLSSPPAITISGDKLKANAYASMAIDVLKGDQVITVFAISLNISGIGDVDISGNKIGGSVEVTGFSLSVKSSSIGNLPVSLVQPVIQTLLQTFFLPAANKFLKQGLPLPSFHGFGFKNAEINYTDTKVAFCSDVEFGQSSWI